MIIYINKLKTLNNFISVSFKHNAINGKVLTCIAGSNDRSGRGIQLQRLNLKIELYDKILQETVVCQ